MDVTLTFITFDLENDPLPGGDGDCKYDWLEVWDGLPGGETLRIVVTTNGDVVDGRSDGQFDLYDGRAGQ